MRCFPAQLFLQEISEPLKYPHHYFQEQEIIFFSMETGMTKNYFDYQLYQIPLSGFLPTMKLIITTSNPGMLKQDHVK